MNILLLKMIIKLDNSINKQAEKKLIDELVKKIENSGGKKKNIKKKKNVLKKFLNNLDIIISVTPCTSMNLSTSIYIFI